MLGIQDAVILSDKSHSYVWKAVPLETGFFTAKKIKIVLTGLNHIGSHGVLEAIKSDSLALNDILLKSVPKNLKDGDIVFCPSERYIFMPGDEVKVKIDVEVTDTTKL